MRDILIFRGLLRGLRLGRTSAEQIEQFLADRPDFTDVDMIDNMRTMDYFYDNIGDYRVVLTDSLLGTLLSRGMTVTSQGLEFIIYFSEEIISRYLEKVSKETIDNFGGFFEFVLRHGSVHALSATFNRFDRSLMPFLTILTSQGTSNHERTLKIMNFLLTREEISFTPNDAITIIVDFFLEEYLGTGDDFNTLIRHPERADGIYREILEKMARRLPPGIDLNELGYQLYPRFHMILRHSGLRPQEIQVLIAKERDKNLKRHLKRLDEEEEARKMARTENAPCEEFNRECSTRPLLVTDWCDVPLQNIIKKNDICFDVEELLHSFESGFNTEVHGYPTPQYPNNPFNRVPYSLQDIRDTLKAGEKVGLDSQFPVLKRFLNKIDDGTLDAILYDGKPFTDSETRPTREAETFIEKVLGQQGGSRRSRRKSRGVRTVGSGRMKKSRRGRSRRNSKKVVG